MLKNIVFIAHAYYILCYIRGSMIWLGFCCYVKETMVNAKNVLGFSQTKLCFVILVYIGTKQQVRITLLPKGSVLMYFISVN